MKAHIIENGVVINTILVDSLDSLDALHGVTLVEAVEGSIGYLYDGVTFIDPDPSKNDIVAQLAKDIRVERNNILKNTVDTLNAARWASMASVKQDEWLQYRQALLDIPAQSGFPKEVQWPPIPD